MCVKENDKLIFKGDNFPLQWELASWAYLPNNKPSCANFLQTFQVWDFVSFSFFTFGANKERKRHPKRKKSRPVLNALTACVMADYRLSADIKNVTKVQFAPIKPTVSAERQVAA